MFRSILCFGVVTVAVVGCNDAKSTVDATNQQGSNSSAASSQPVLLEPLVMKAKPATPLSVRDVLTKKDGELVVFSGRTPPENVKPFNTAVAAVLLMAPEDLDKQEIKEEFECEDAATCPSCKKVLDAHAVRVELVDSSGAVVPASLEGFRGLKVGSVMTFEGEVKRDGKDKKTIRVVAKKFYPG